MRWELMADHYLNVPNSEWERTETDRDTGRVARQRVKVPEYLSTGTIVCHEGKGERRDQVFFGDPTPDMLPLDDEARDLSATFETRWSYKPEGAEISASQSIINNMAEVMTRPVEIAGMSELVSTMSAATKANQDLVETFKLKARL